MNNDYNNNKRKKKSDSQKKIESHEFKKKYPYSDEAEYDSSAAFNHTEPDKPSAVLRLIFGKLGLSALLIGCGCLTMLTDRRMRLYQKN